MTFAAAQILVASTFVFQGTGTTGGFDARDYATGAELVLTVEKSQYLTPGTNRLAAQTAFVTLAHGLRPGNADGVEVLFVADAPTAARVREIASSDGPGVKSGNYAVLVLYLNKDGGVSQANLTVVFPGTTVTRTIAWKTDDLKRYFSEAGLRNRRLRLKSAGTFAEREAAADTLQLRWTIDLDLPVKREITR
jgi:hypothetical protein